MLIKFKGTLNLAEVNKILSNYQVNPSIKSWDEAQVSLMVQNYIEAKKSQQEDVSIFEENDDAQDGQTAVVDQRTSKVILMEISNKFKNESNFKILCNKIFKTIRGYLKDKVNPINRFVGILANDYEDNHEILSLIDELCAKHELISELKPKGILIKINPASFEGNLRSLITVLKSHKDESLGIVSTKEKGDKAGRKRNVTDERVEAMKEAHERRRVISNQQRQQRPQQPYPQNGRVLGQNVNMVPPNGYVYSQNAYYAPGPQNGYYQNPHRQVHPNYGNFAYPPNQ